ncbi:peptidase M23 [Streptomyces sp. NPDC021100]|uniref:peptidase M23 n=1 Tax=Streptomyces sp. NPDC021100 TaxID=3365114 RepID=UPI0037B9B003
MENKELIHAALQASGAVKKGFALKLGIIGGAIFVVLLMLMGMMAPGGGASTAGCTDTGAGTDDASPVSSSSGQSTGSVRKEQVANAKIIDGVAAQLGLPGRATLIALMAAMQESGIRNLHYGDRDSVGLFQQRPSADWGTRAQILEPKFAAESFFKGRGTNEGLIHIKNWQTRPPGDVAADIEKPDERYRGLYAGHEPEIRGIAKEAGINLDRKGTATGTTGTTGKTDGGATQASTRGQCDAQDTKGTGGGKFSDGKQTWTLNNPRSVAEAIAWAKSHAGSNSTGSWYARCLAFTAIVYGWSFSGVNYAIDHYNVVPKDMRHDGDRHPPPGALMYWDTGHRAGHIAVYLGGGKIASNDILRSGYIDVVDADLIETKWGAKYVGWTPPHFPKAG